MKCQKGFNKIEYLQGKNVYTFIAIQLFGPGKAWAEHKKESISVLVVILSSSGRGSIEREKNQYLYIKLATRLFELIWDWALGFGIKNPHFLLYCHETK